MRRKISTEHPRDSTVSVNNAMLPPIVRDSEMIISALLRERCNLHSAAASQHGIIQQRTRMGIRISNVGVKISSDSCNDTVAILVVKH